MSRTFFRAIEKNSRRRKIQVGDYIKCHSHDDMTETAYSLHIAGVECDFCYNINGESGLWLVVREVRE